jgi:hypothetical protein
MRHASEIRDCRASQSEDASGSAAGSTSRTAPSGAARYQKPELNMTSTLKGNRKKPPTNAATAAAAANPTLRATRQP